MRKKLDKITDLILENTIEKNIPTVVFISRIEETDLIIKLISIKTQKEYDEANLTPDDWAVLADTMLMLANIPLILRHINSVEDTINKITDFCAEMGENKGLVVVDCDKNDFPKIENIKNIIIEVV